MNRNWFKKGLTGFVLMALILMAMTLSASADTQAIEGLWVRNDGQVLHITGDEGFFHEINNSAWSNYPVTVGDQQLRNIVSNGENEWTLDSLGYFQQAGNRRVAWSETATLTLREDGQSMVINSITVHPFTEKTQRGTAIYQRLGDAPAPVEEAEPILPVIEPVEEEPELAQPVIEPVEEETAQPVQPVTEPGDSNNEVFDSGVRMGWSRAANALGYRVFRSTSRDDLGISVTDFYITATRFVDVNVAPDTEYHYIVLPVLAEARPLEGIDELLGDAVAKFSRRTGTKITHVGSEKSFNILQLDNPIMIVNGVNQEIDPGRGTTPIVISGRSMVPIRAIVEAMGGNVGWEGSESKISLNARGQSVEMWLNGKEVRRNGASAQMDVAPVSQGGRTFVPVRFASENLDAKADWINSTREIVIVYTK
ncbi:copper amine oxidase N-terminal domain-containing protein [Anoxynatronum buryatiense]|uniref:Copper amine oxidase N-terminal domain-containing protein n=1 Tax=Anoxynatronum buryatiense TaxID=489973 RepID=A0AA45WW42_9CLOT|nr:copper amine oxidase N-terminal domain-containing protein [Anoxynatronum buryatiense]SMP55302.1 Copper amine oxidase N-terminal domain-containing protein [Anoxynatronum buryatiense]